MCRKMNNENIVKETFFLHIYGKTSIIVNI